MATSQSQFQKFLESPEAPKTHLHIGNIPLESNSQLNRRLKQPMFVLHPVFSHLNYLLIQILSETGHGEFNVSIEKRNNEFVICIKTHLSERYLLNIKESQVIHKAYQQIFKAWVNWC